MKNLLLLFVLLVTSLVWAQNDCLIPNGSFEDWLSEDRPQYWFTTNIAGNEAGHNDLSGYDWRNVFRTPGKFGSGIRMKNVSVADFIKEKKPNEWARLPASIKEQLRSQSFSSTLLSCDAKDCNQLMAGGNESAIMTAMTIDVPEGKAPAYLKGYYKSNLKGGDKLWIWPVLTDGNDQVTGGVRPGRTENVIQKNTGQWTEFIIPLDYFPKRLDKTRKLMLQIQMVGKSFPSSYPTGVNPVTLAMKYPSQEGSEISLDELCFGGVGQEVDPDDPDLPGNTDGGVSDGGDVNDDGDNDEDNKIYVATNGNDGNSGGYSDPFATLQRAITVAKGKRLQGKRMIIIIKDGTYRQEAVYEGSAGASLPTLEIRAENRHQAIFIGSAPISSTITWEEVGNGIYRSSNGILHPEQQPVIDYSNPGALSNPMEMKVPALIVNGSPFKPAQIIHQTPNSYVFAPMMFMVNPSGIDLNSATIQVSVSEYAIHVKDGGNVVVSGLRLQGYPVTPYAALSDQTVSGLKGVQIVDCIYE